MDLNFLHQDESVIKIWNLNCATGLSIADFQELIEDIEDLAAIAERRNENTVSHEKVLEELRNDGLI